MQLEQKYFQRDGLVYGVVILISTSPTSVSNLLVLKFRCVSIKSFPFTDIVEFPQLKTLHFEDIYFETHSLFTQLLAGCPVLEDFKAASSVYVHHDFPTFHNLTHLAINNISDLVVQVLHHCPKLQHLDLYQKTQSELDNGEQGSWVVPKSAPECLSSYLRTCTIRDFALQDDIMLVRYILNNAGFLETMTIWSVEEQHEEIEIELSFCPRASATCRLSVYRISNEHEASQ